MAYSYLVAQKRRVERVYNMRIKVKILSEGDLVWKTILPIGSKDPKFGKWSPNWERPFKVFKVLRGGAYHLASLEGVPHRKVINSKYLNKYYPTM